MVLLGTCAKRIPKAQPSRRNMIGMDRTFVICKPDAVERRLVGEIIRRIEREGLS